jgi:hypothetical protein
MIKAFTSLFFLFWLAAVGVSGQTAARSTDLSPVVVIKKDWSMRINSRKVSENNSSMLNTDPFGPIKETNQAQKYRDKILRREKIRADQGLPPEPRPALIPTELERNSHTTSAVYIYRAKVKNTGGKTVRKITWDYVFFDAETKQEVGRRQFVSEVKIGAGKTGDLLARSVSPPTGSVNVAPAGATGRANYSEEVIIKSIEFVDGSLWPATGQ